MNKKNILRGALIAFGVASVMGLACILSDYPSPRLGMAAGVFGLMGISTFFVGIAYPKED